MKITEVLMEYEFYIYTDNGENTWHWDLKEWKNVKKNIQDNLIVANDESYSVEIQRWYGEGDFDYVEIYPVDNSQELPKYVQEYVKKALS
tara:strand:+ start:217 stop:486 length:270 start_codon:yes stop_codon:yes gene_type:complete